jgi:all-trans-retinol dehydrogenase (NAD+)
LKTTTDALKDEGFDCAAYVVDISDKEQVYEVAKKVKQEIGKVDVLINNAGIVTCRPFLELPDKAIETTYGVNILSHYWVIIKFYLQS